MNTFSLSNYRFVGFTIEKFTQLYNSGKIKLDLAFQRKENHSLENMQDFISCIFQGHCVGLLSLASTNKASESNKYLLKCREENYDYISIDGNNRTVALSRFINNEFAVRIEAGAKRVYFFNELKSEQQRAFLDLKVPTVIYDDVSIHKCADIFIGHNSSVKISEQEARNAVICKLSKFIREYEKKLRNSFTKYTFTEDNRKRKNDEGMLDVLCLQINPSRVTCKDTRNFVWEDQRDINFDIEYFKETFNTAMTLLNRSKSNKTQSRSLLRDFAIVRGILFENYLDIIETFNTVSFLDYFIKKRTELMSSRKMYEVSKNESVTYEGLMKKPIDKQYHRCRIEELRAIANDYYTERLNKETNRRVA